MPPIDYRAARADVGLAEALALLDFFPRGRRGAQVRGACPLHAGAGPACRSFAAHLGRGVWHCFHCGAGGNVLDLWAAATGLPLYEAVLDLYRRLGREAPRLRPPPPARAGPPPP